MPPPKTRSSSKKTESKEAKVHNGGAAADKQRRPPPNTAPPSKGKRKAPSATSQVAPTDTNSGKIVGSRMSSAKHSGLLARDDQVLRELLEEGEEEEGLSTAQLVSDGKWGEGSEGEESDLQHVTGRDIYSIKKLHRSAQKPKKKQTETRVEVSATPKTSMEAIRGRRREDGASPRVMEEGVSDGVEKTAVQSSIGTRDSKRSKKEAKKGKGKIQWTSDSEENDDISDEEEDDEEMASIAAQLNKGATAEHALEDYFTAHTGKSGVTSDRTLSRLARPRLEQEAVLTALQAAPSPFQDDCQHLLEDYTHLYPYWLLQMQSGFNILLYGLGSKKRLMEDFCKNSLPGTCHVVVNGYFPGLTVKQLLATLTLNLLGHSGTFKSHSEHARFVTNTLEKRSGNVTVPRDVFLIIHNLDGPMLRNDRAQAALSILAVSKHVHIVASVDHINSALLWDQTKLSRLKWVWHDVTTFEAYGEETSYENSLLVRHSGSLALSSLTHVMKSLTPNARGIFKLLANYQLEHKKEAERTYQGLSFGECYRRCREKFLVNSDLTLRAQLTEFRDHKLVRSNKGNDGVEYLLIPVDDATLAQFLSEFIE